MAVARGFRAVRVYCDRCGFVYDPKPDHPTLDAYEPGKPDIGCSKKTRGTLREVTPGLEEWIKLARRWEEIADHRRGMLEQLYSQASRHGLVVSHTSKGIVLKAREEASGLVREPVE